MTNETIAGLFGMLATLVGVAAGYALSFSRDRRLQRDRFRELVTLLIHDIDSIREMLSEDRRMAIETNSLEAFRQQGFVTMLQPELAKRLLNTYWSIARINHLLDHQNNILDIIMVRGEEKKLGEKYYDMGNYYYTTFEERKRLIAEQIEAIPQLAQELRNVVSPNRANASDRCRGG